MKKIGAGEKESVLSFLSGLCSTQPTRTRPPYSDAHRVPISIFQFSELADYLESIVLCKEQLLISGNFDIHVDNAVGADAIKLIDLP